MRRKKVRTPGSRNVMHWKKRKTSAQTCSICGSVLHGINRMNTAELGKVSASRKKVSRKFGGSMCASCSREALRTRARNI